MLRHAVHKDEKAAYELICDMEQTKLDETLFHEIFCGQQEDFSGGYDSHEAGAGLHPSF